MLVIFKVIRRRKKADTMSRGDGDLYAAEEITWGQEIIEAVGKGLEEVWSRF